MTRDELVSNGFSAFDNISIVYHSYNEKVTPSSYSKKSNRFISVGKLSPHKGIEDLLNIFSNKSNCNLTIVGKGSLINLVTETSRIHKNITYKGYTNGFKNLIPIYNQHSFLILNSLKTGAWEELFGIVIIEAMACGLIPITTNHTGPREIITPFINGILCEEGKIIEGIDYALNINQNDYITMREKSIERSKDFQSSIISHRWEPILKYLNNY